MAVYRDRDDKHMPLTIDMIRAEARASAARIRQLYRRDAEERDEQRTGAPTRTRREQGGDHEVMCGILFTGRRVRICCWDAIMSRLWRRERRG